MSQFYKKILTHVAIFCLVAGALTVGVFFFKNKIEDYTSQIAQTRREFTERSVRLQTYAILKSDYEEKGKGYLATLERYVPKRDDLINLREEFKFIADQAGVRSSLQFTGETPPQDELSAGVLRFGLTLEGDYDALFNFVARLEKFRYLTQIEGLSVSRGDEKSEMKIRGKVFFRKGNIL